MIEWLKIWWQDIWDDRLLGGKRSPDWPRLRREHLKKEPICVVCEGDEDLQVHHIKPVHLFPELEREPSNYITLCEKNKRNCHFQFGHLYSFHSYNPNVVNDAIVWRQKIRNRA